MWLSRFPFQSKVDRQCMYHVQRIHVDRRETGKAWTSKSIGGRWPRFSRNVSIFYAAALVNELCATTQILERELLRCGRPTFVAEQNGIRHFCSLFLSSWSSSSPSSQSNYTRTGSSWSFRAHGEVIVSIEVEPTNGGLTTSNDLVVIWFFLWQKRGLLLWRFLVACSFASMWSTRENLAPVAIWEVIFSFEYFCCWLCFGTKVRVACYAESSLLLGEMKAQMFEWSKIYEPVVYIFEKKQRQLQESSHRLLLRGILNY